MLPRAAELAQQALVLAMMLSLPALLVAALTGLVTGAFSTATQIHDAALSFVPRLAAVALVLVIAAPWGARVLARYTAELWRAIPVLVR